MFPAYEKINNDEYPDICILDYGYKNVFYINNGFGKFTDTLTYSRLHRYSNESAFYDIDHDGFTDIISYSDYSYMPITDSSNLKMARNNADNTFTTYYFDDFDQREGCHMFFNDYNNDTVLNAFLRIIDFDGYTDSIIVFNINKDFSISSCDTIDLELPIEIQNTKFYDLDGNNENDMIINDPHYIYACLSMNGRFTGDLDTIISVPDHYINDFVLAKINNDTIDDFVVEAGDYIRVFENFDGSFFERIYDLNPPFVSKPYDVPCTFISI